MSANEKFMQLQNQIRNNSNSIQEYIDDLSSWAEEITQKDKTVETVHAKGSHLNEGARGAKAKQKPLPPIRSVQLERERVSSSQKSSYVDLIKKKPVANSSKGEKMMEQPDSKDYKRDVTPMPTYYNKWDKFDIDKAIDSVEKDEVIGFDKTLSAVGKEITKSSKLKEFYEPSQDDDLTEEEKMQLEKEKMLKQTSGAKPFTKIVVKGGSNPSSISSIESLK